jgi:hypothetical protein
MATGTFRLYAAHIARAYGGTTSGGAPAFDYLSDTLKLMLTDGYTPDYDTHAVKADVTGEITATGYTAGGATLAGKAVTITPANSWGIQRANSTAYAVGDLVRPATGNGYLYRCVVAGTSGGSPPTYSTVLGRETTDGTVVWVTAGGRAVQFDADDVSWPGSTITATDAAVLYDDTEANDALIGALVFDTPNLSTSAGAFDVQWHPAGIWVVTLP